MKKQPNQTRWLERFAARYNPATDFDRYLIEYRFRAIRDTIPRRGAWLEMGCAEGMMTQHLAALCDTLDVVEGSQRYIAAAQKLVARASGLREKVTRASGLRNQSNRKRDARATVAFHHALFEEFEPPRKYDVIIASGILHEIENPQRVLKKAAGWLKPGGILHANVPNAFSLHRRIGVAMGALKDCRDFSERDRAFGHFRVYDRPLLRRHVERAGLRITQQGGIFLKPLSNAQMMEWKPELLEAFFAVGKSLPDLCAEIYINARKS